MCLRLSSERSGAPCPARLAWRERQLRQSRAVGRGARVAAKAKRGASAGVAGGVRGKAIAARTKGRRLSFKEK